MNEEELTCESNNQVQSNQHQPLHVVGFSILNQQVHQEDGHEQYDRLEVGEEEGEVMAGDPANNDE